MNDLHPDLLEALEAVRLVSANRYVIRDKTFDVAPDPKRAVAAEALLLADLEQKLYARLYTRSPSSETASDSNGLARRDFLSALSAANSGQGTMEPGWKIERLGVDGDERLILFRRGLKFWVAPTEIQFPPGSADPPETCRVRVPKELRYLSHGFYFLVGDAPSDEPEPATEQDRRIVLRYYWNLTSKVACDFVATATSVLNRAEIPFELKVLSDPESYVRADSGVLYVSRRDARKVADAVARIHARIASGLRPQVPLFTRKLANGLAIAEDPANQKSFGQHRCELVARSLWRSFGRDEFDLTARASTLADVFREEGLDPLHPDLHAGSSVAELGDAMPVLFGPSAVGSSPTKPARVSPIELAEQIGWSLCDSAHWDRSGQFCNWIGRSFQGNGPVNESPWGSSALGPEIYNGSAGVALFLAQLYDLTGDAGCRRTAVGAMNRSIRQSHRRPTDLGSTVSFFGGLVGLAHASSRVGNLVGEVSLVDQAETLLDGVCVSLDSPPPLDLIGGIAGAIVALLGLSRMTGQTRERDLAITLGEQLLARADRGDRFWTWEPDLASEAQQPLTGISHGASGIALALLELHAETGREVFLEAASNAFAYENFVFDDNQCNWPDFRKTGADINPPRLNFARVWCHGAPGIALARMRASLIHHVGADQHRGIAKSAMATTLRAIDDHLDWPGADVSLCHGLAGLMEIADIASRVLDDRACRDRVERISDRLIERHSRPPGEPTVVPRPSLMLGLAGVGYAMLRRIEPGRVPSILLVDACV